MVRVIKGVVSKRTFAHLQRLYVDTELYGFAFGKKEELEP
jgi:hypothetical protein